MADFGTGRARRRPAGAFAPPAIPIWDVYPAGIVNQCDRVETASWTEIAGGAQQPGNARLSVSLTIGIWNGRRVVGRPHPGAAATAILTRRRIP